MKKWHDLGWMNFVRTHARQPMVPGDGEGRRAVSPTLCAGPPTSLLGSRGRMAARPLDARHAVHLYFQLFWERMVTI